MAGFMRMMANEIFMCGLRQIPILGQAAEVVDNVQKRYEVLHHHNRLEIVERDLATFERKLRDLVQGEIQATITGISRSDLDVTEFSTHIRNLQGIKQNGWSPALFQGLLERSAHWEELRRNPTHYGTILGDHQDSRDPTAHR